MSVITTIDQVKSLTYGVGGASGDKGKNEEICHVDTFDRSAAMSSAGILRLFIVLGAANQIKFSYQYEYIDKQVNIEC